MKGRAGRWPREKPRDQAADDRSADAEKRGHDEAEMLDARHNRARNQADDKTDDDGPNDV